MERYVPGQKEQALQRGAQVNPGRSADSGDQMNDFYQDFPSLKADLDRVREEILKHLQGSSPLVQEAITEIVQARGKMLRPAFLLLTARMGRFNPEKVYELAAALEMLHIATLIHDDVIDDADTRRGIPTVHTKMGTRRAVLTGDFLFSRCFSIAARYATIENGRDLSRAVAFICDSEIDQSAKLFQSDTSRRGYFRRIAGKTAALFLLAFQSGAVEGGLKRKYLMWARRVGYNIGMAFQIIDDILDCSASSSDLGKPVASDIREGNFTLPVIIAKERDHDGTLGFLLQKRPYTDDTVGAILDFLQSSGALQEAKRVAETYTKRALSALRLLPDTEARGMLLDITGRLLQRSC